MRRLVYESRSVDSPFTIALVTAATLMFVSGATAALVTVPSVVMALYYGSAAILAALTASYWLGILRSRLADRDGCTHRRTLE